MSPWWGLRVGELWSKDAAAETGSWAEADGCHWSPRTQPEAVQEIHT